jgi:hypothetical protein
MGIDKNSWKSGAADHLLPAGKLQSNFRKAGFGPRRWALVELRRTVGISPVSYPRS